MSTPLPVTPRGSTNTVLFTDRFRRRADMYAAYAPPVLENSGTLLFTDRFGRREDMYAVYVAEFKAG